MEWLFENLGLLIFLVFFILPAIGRISKRKKKEEGKKGEAKPGAKQAPPPEGSTLSRGIKEAARKGGADWEELNKAVKAWQEKMETAKGRTREIKPSLAKTARQRKKRVAPDKVHKDKIHWASPSPPAHTTVAPEPEHPDVAMPSEQGSLPFAALPRGATASSAYHIKKAVSARERIAALPPLQQAVIWKEILDPPRGL